MHRCALAGLALLVLPSGAWAQELDRTGAVLSLGGVIGIEDFNEDQIPNSLGVDKFDPNRSFLRNGDTTRAGVDFRAGYRLHARVEG